MVENLRVVLVATRNPLNMGAAARALSNFGVSHLRLVTPFSPALKAARSAVGAVSILEQAQEFRTVADAIADCNLIIGTGTASRRKPSMPIWTLPEAIPLIHQHIHASPADKRVALLFGNEKWGLTNDNLSHCDWMLRIPTSETGEGNDSMNLGQAVAVCLYAITCFPGASPDSLAMREASLAAAPATAAESERLLMLLQECLIACDYIPIDGHATAEQEHREFLRGLGLPSPQAEKLMGMLRKMLWKMKSPSP